MLERFRTETYAGVLSSDRIRVPRTKARAAFRTRAFLAFMWCAVPLLGPQAVDVPRATADKADAPPRFSVPDGTEVKLRFAQPVIGPAALSLMQQVNRPPSMPPLASRGDWVRLVAAADVRVGNKVIVSKGAIAEATVDGVALANPRSLEIETGLWLRLEWVKAVTGEKLRLPSCG